MRTGLNRWTAVVLGAILAAAVAGCSSGGDEESAPPPALTPPAGFSVVSDGAKGFAIAVPEDWRQLPLNGLVAYDEAAAKLQAENPETKDAIDTGRTLIGRGVELFALDPADNGATTVNLLVVDAPNDESLEVASKGATDLLARQGATNITREFTVLGGQEAAKATFVVPVVTATGIRQVTTTQYYILRNGKSYVLTLAGTGPDRDAIVQTLRIA